jgi:hypothetical protein
VAARTLLLLSCILVGCPNPPERECVSVNVACAPANDATYEGLYTLTFAPRCAKSGVSCHASTGRQGGIDFQDRDAAYDALLGKSVVAGDPGCSELVRRIQATDGNVRMPPGESIPQAEQCAIVKWIADGAKR